MSDGINRVFLLGNLGTDPEVRYTSGGTAVMHFRMATNESFLDRNRELTERTEWHNIVMFGARAEGLSRVLSKGTCLLVEGTLRTSSYEKDGTKRYRTEIHARDICFASGSSRMPDASQTVRDSRESDESFVPVEMPPIPEDTPPMVMDERPAAASATRSQRGKRGSGSAHRTGQQGADSYPF
jgi:single-strand DNA-binding protein